MEDIRPLTKRHYLLGSESPSYGEELMIHIKNFEEKTQHRFLMSVTRAALLLSIQMNTDDFNKIHMTNCLPCHGADLRSQQDYIMDQSDFTFYRDMLFEFHIHINTLPKDEVLKRFSQYLKIIVTHKDDAFCELSWDHFQEEFKIIESLLIRVYPDSIRNLGDEICRLANVHSVYEPGYILSREHVELPRNGYMFDV